MDSGVLSKADYERTFDMMETVFVEMTERVPMTFSFRGPAGDEGASLPLFPDGRRGISIAAKLSLMIIAGVGAIFLAIVFYGYSTSRAVLQEEFAARMENLGNAAESKFRQIPRVAEAVTVISSPCSPFSILLPGRFPK